MIRYKIIINNSDSGSEKLIANVLHDVAGVERTDVSLDQQRAVIQLRDDAKEPDVILLNKQLEGYGYQLQPQSQVLETHGIESEPNRASQATIWMHIKKLLRKLWS